MPPKKKATPKPPRVYVNHTDFVVKASKGGKGLFARHDLPANARLPYKGKVLTTAEMKALDDDAYIMASGRKGEYLDANPAYGHSSWVAGRVNEPSHGEKANMIITHERTPTVRPVLVTVRPIAADEELLLHYGTGYRRVGYRVGSRAAKPRWL
jgi:hypothetical protein